MMIIAHESSPSSRYCCGNSVLAASGPQKNVLLLRAKTTILDDYQTVSGIATVCTLVLVRTQAEDCQGCTDHLTLGC